jgi:hypothetical protein
MEILTCILYTFFYNVSGGSGYDSKPVIYLIGQLFDDNDK